MGEVVHVDFVRRARTVRNPFMLSFIHMLERTGFQDSMIAEILAAIADQQVYAKVSADVRKIVDIFNQHTANLN
jgi:hypothetical protein